MWNFADISVVFQYWLRYPKISWAIWGPLKGTTCLVPFAESYSNVYLENGALCRLSILPLGQLFQYDARTCLWMSILLWYESLHRLTLYVLHCIWVRVAATIRWVTCELSEGVVKILERHRFEIKVFEVYIPFSKESCFVLGWTVAGAMRSHCCLIYILFYRSVFLWPVCTSWQNQPVVSTRLRHNGLSYLKHRYHLEIWDSTFYNRCTPITRMKVPGFVA